MYDIVDDFGELIQMAAQLAWKAAGVMSAEQKEEFARRLTDKLDLCGDWLREQEG